MKRSANGYPVVVDDKDVVARELRDLKAQAEDGNRKRTGGLFAALVHTHPLSDIPSINIPSGADLNTYFTQGLYRQTSNASAAAGANYPVPVAGFLKVFDAASMWYHEYTLYNNGTAGGGRVFTRSYYSPVGGWSLWREQAQPGYNGVPFAQAAGKGVATSSGSIVTVTFPVGRFTQPPVVTASQSGGGNVAVPYLLPAPTTSSFSARLYTLAAAQYTGVIDWTAVQMTAASASG